MSDNIPTVQYPLAPEAAEALMEPAAICDPHAGLDRILARGPGNLTPADIMHRRIDGTPGAAMHPVSLDSLSGVDRTLARGPQGYSAEEIAARRTALAQTRKTHTM